MAAYRLRSFSESESWNIRIECSIWGLYVMGGHPLRGRGSPSCSYTACTEDREVIESAILRSDRDFIQSLSEPDAGLGTYPACFGLAEPPRGRGQGQRKFQRIFRSRQTPGGDLFLHRRDQHSGGRMRLQS